MHAGVIQTGASSKTLTLPGDESGPATLLVGQTAIFLEKVSLSTPTGEVLTNPLSFRIEAGQHTFISGPNGVGKSTLLRVIAGLCDAVGASGTIGQPTGMMVLPQRPYLATGSLRAQVLYPTSVEAATAHGWGDAEVQGALDRSGLGSVTKREGGLDAVREWADVLSGGERQQLAIARLVLHRPKFAMLDECTSAMTAENETHSFQLVKSLGTTLFTVAHQPTLRNFHTHELLFDGVGGCVHRLLPVTPSA